MTFFLASNRARLHVGHRILDLQQSLIVTREGLFLQATHDGLTGLSNRGVALAAFNREQARQLREEGSCAVVLAESILLSLSTTTTGISAATPF